MRVNWVRQIFWVFIISCCIFWAAISSRILFLRNVSLGEPDPQIFLLIVLTLWFFSEYSFLQTQRSKTIVGRTQSKRLALHNVDEFNSFMPPKSYIDNMTELCEGLKDEAPEHLDIMLGEYAVYIAEGIRVLRTGYRRCEVVIVYPKKLIQKHSDYVDFLGDDQSYIGLDHFRDNFPRWVLDYCIKKVPGFLPCGTEIIFADRPHKSAVLAWDVDKREEIWCRGIKDSDVNYGGRESYLTQYSKNLGDENTEKEWEITKESKKRMKKRKKPDNIPAKEANNGSGD